MAASSPLNLPGLLSLLHFCSIKSNTVIILIFLLLLDSEVMHLVLCVSLRPSVEP